MTGVGTKRTVPKRRCTTSGRPEHHRRQHCSSAPPTACLTVERVAYDDTGQFVEYGRHIYRATHDSVQSSLVG